MGGGGENIKAKAGSPIREALVITKPKDDGGPDHGGSSGNDE